LPIIEVNYEITEDPFEMKSFDIMDKTMQLNVHMSMCKSFR